MKYFVALLLLAGMVAAPVTASAQTVPTGFEQAVIAGLQSNGVPNGTIVAVRTYDGYGMALVSIGDTSASVYLQQTAGGWQYLHMNGGAASVSDLERYGIPATAASHLRSGAGAANYRLNRTFKASGSNEGLHAEPAGPSIPLGTGDALLRDLCQRYIQQQHIGSLSVLAARQAGSFATCQVVGLEGGGQVLMHNKGGHWGGVAFTEGLFDYSMLSNRYHVPSATILQLGYRPY